MDLYEKIKWMCMMSGRNIRGVEKACGFGNGTIRRWSDNDPSVSKVKKVAEHFGVTVDDLLGMVTIKEK